MKKNFWIGVFVGVIAFVGIAATVFGVGLYRYNWDNAVVKSIVKVLPYPALKVNRYTYSYYDYLDDLDTLKYFLKQNSQVIPDEGELERSVLQSAYTALILDVLANRYEVDIIDEDYEQALDELLGVEDPSEEDLAEFYTWLEDAYSWDFDTYKEKVISLEILSKKVSLKIIKDLSRETNRLAKETMDEVYQKLQDGGDFAELATNYSEDTSASEGGDLGWFSLNMMVPEFSEKIENMEIGTYTEVFPTEFGYHIVKLEDKRENEETGETEYKASHIIRMGVNLGQIIEEEKEQVDINIYLNGIDAESLL